MKNETEVTDLFPDEKSRKSATRCTKSPKLILPITQRPKKTAAIPVLEDGCCPKCERQLQFAATGEGEAGYNRFDCRIKVVLHDPKTGQVRLKCPGCKETVSTA